MTATPVFTPESAGQRRLVVAKKLDMTEVTYLHIQELLRGRIKQGLEVGLIARLEPGFDLVAV